MKKLTNEKKANLENIWNGNGSIQAKIGKGVEMLNTLNNSAKITNGNNGVGRKGEKDFTVKVKGKNGKYVIYPRCECKINEGAEITAETEKANKYFVFGYVFDLPKTYAEFENVCINQKLFICEKETFLRYVPKHTHGKGEKIYTIRFRTAKKINNKWCELSRGYKALIDNSIPFVFGKIYEYGEIK